MSKRYCKMVFELIFVLAVSFSPSLPVYAAVLTLTDGETVYADEIHFENSIFSLKTGSESLLLPRDAVRDVSFTAKQKETVVLATESADLIGLLEKAGETLQKYPDAPTVTVLDEVGYRLLPDGTNRTHIRMVTFLAKEEALDEAEINIGFDPNRERIHLLHARSMAPDGTVSSLSPDRITITKPSSGGEYYNPYQTMSFTIPGAAVGCIVDYAYEIEEFNPFDPKLFQGQSFFQDNDPVVKSICTVRVPKGTPIYYVAKQCPPEKAAPVVHDEGEETVYTWEFTDLSPVIPEPMMPPWRDLVPNVVFSLQKDASYLWDKLTPMYQKRLVVTDAVKKQVEKLTSKCRDIHEKMAELYKFCQQEIRYVSIKGSLAANQVGRAAEETLKNRFGDCTDKGMLLAAMIKCLGVEAYPVGIRTNDAGTAIREIGLFDDNHCITEVHLAGEIFYLDSTANDYRYPALRSDDHDVSVDNAILRCHGHVPLPPPESNATLASRTITLMPDGTMNIINETIATGSFEAALRGWIRGLKPEEFEQSVRESIGGLSPNYTLATATHADPLDFSKPFSMGSVYTLYKYAPRSGKYMIFEIPAMRLHFSEAVLASRTYDIVYSTTSLRNDSVKVKLPAGFRVKYIPNPIKVENNWIKYSAVYTQASDTISLERLLAITARIVPAAAYQAYKTDLEKISRSAEDRIFLEEVPAQEGAK